MVLSFEDQNQTLGVPQTISRLDVKEFSWDPKLGLDTYNHFVDFVNGSKFITYWLNRILQL